MASIILAAPGFSGELTPVLELARELLTRGQNVTILSSATSEQAVSEVGAQFAQFGDASDADEATRLLAEASSLPPGPEQLNHQWMRLFADPIADQHAALQRLLDQDPESVLISNSVFLGAWPIALGAPGRRPSRWIALGANPLALSSLDTTPFGPVPALPGQDVHSGNRAANADLAAATEPTRRHIEAIVRALGANGVVPPFVDGIVTVPDLFASLSVAAFDFPRTDLPSTVRYVGILEPRAPRSWSPPAWWSDLDDDRPVVAVTQGTVANSDLTELVEPTLQALADRDVLVVAATGRDDNAISSLPDNARVEAFVPFDLLLPRCSALVTNGGFGATQQALSAQVPVVIAGDTEDKPMTAARVAFHGVGVSLNTSTPSAAALGQALDQVLHDSRIATKVDKMAHAYRAHDARQEITRLALGNGNDSSARRAHELD